MTEKTDTANTRYFLHPADLEELHIGLCKVRDSLTLMSSVTPNDGDMRGAADVLGLVDTHLGEVCVMLEDADTSGGLILAEPLREHLCSTLERLSCVLVFMSARIEPGDSPPGLAETLELLGEKLGNLASMLWIVKLDEFVGDSHE